MTWAVWWRGFTSGLVAGWSLAVFGIILILSR